ncbi:hypothetical protein KCU99_g277, partial [Aureobasidium melanogenum]
MSADWCLYRPLALTWAEAKTSHPLKGISDGLRSTMTLCTPKAFKRAASATAALPAPTMKTFVLHMFVKAFELGAQDPDLPCQQLVNQS